MSKPKLRIIRFEAENYRRLRAVEITPEGRIVVISGRNGQGKSSILDAIWTALGGAGAVKGITKPIRDGEDEAYVTLDLGDITVHRRWNEDGTTDLIVRDGDTGKKIAKPQAYLDAMLSRLAFDPLAFAEADPKTQRQTLLDVTGVDPAAVDALDARRAVAYERRTEVGRVVTSLTGRLEGMPRAADGVPDVETATADVLAELDAAQDELRRAAGANEAAEVAAEEARRAADAIVSARAALAAAETAKLAADDAATAAVTYAASFDTAQANGTVMNARERLEGLDAANAAVWGKLLRAEVSTELKSARTEQEGFTAEIGRIDAEKAALLAGVTMPVEGLGMSEDGMVTFHGVPLAQASSAERLRTSVAIAAAGNPDLRVIRVQDGSLLDEDSMRLLAELAEAYDLQVWVERVEDDQPGALVIEDGSVVAADAGVGGAA